MGGGADHHLREPGHRRDGGLVDGQLTQGRGKNRRARKRQTAHRHPVHRPEQDHAPYGLAACREPRIGQRCSRTGINISRMRDDDGFGNRSRRLPLRPCRRQQGMDVCGQSLGLAGVEGTRNSGRTDLAHGRSPFACGWFPKMSLIRCLVKPGREWAGWPPAFQFLSFQPVRKIHHTAHRHRTRKPRMAATLMPTLTSATP